MRSHLLGGGVEEQVLLLNLPPQLLLLRRGEALLSRNVEWVRGGLVSKAHRLLYHSALGSRVIKKKKKEKYLRVGTERAHGRILARGKRYN